MLASQLCAELEGRDGQIGAALFTTYGPFLAGEKAFRTHAKLPNVVERLVAHDNWDAVQWVADVAEQHSDMLEPDGRENEIAHLADRVKEKLEEFGEDNEPPDALRKLSDLLPSQVS